MLYQEDWERAPGLDPSLRARLATSRDTGANMDAIDLQVFLRLVICGTLTSMFVWSGTYKLMAPIPAAVAMVKFRISRHVHPAHARLLGAVELGVGAGTVLVGEPLLDSVFRTTCYLRGANWTLAYPR